MSHIIRQTAVHGHVVCTVQHDAPHALRPFRTSVTDSTGTESYVQSFCTRGAALQCHSTLEKIQEKRSDFHK